MVIFNPTAEETRALEALISAIPHTGQARRQPSAVDPAGSRRAPAAAAGGKVFLTLERSLPPALDGLRVFVNDGSPGRISSASAGCRPARLSARGDRSGLPRADGRVPAKSGRRIDFVTIHDPSPTDTPELSFALLQATADAAGWARPHARQSGETASLEPGAPRRHQGRLDCHARDGPNPPDRPIQQRLSAVWTGIVRRATRSASSPSCRLIRRIRTATWTGTEAVHRRVANAKTRPRALCHSSCTGSRSSTSGKRRSTISPSRGATGTRSRRHRGPAGRRHQPGNRS